MVLFSWKVTSNYCFFKYENIYSLYFFYSPNSAKITELVILRKMQYFRHEILAFFAILPILSYLHFWDFCVICVSGNEKYTKKDASQTFNGSTKGHEKNYFWTFLERAKSLIRGSGRINIYLGHWYIFWRRIFGFMKRSCSFQLFVIFLPNFFYAHTGS